MEKFEALQQRMRSVAHLRSALAVLQWDQEVYMPKQGAGLRAHTLAHLAELAHNQFTALDDDGTLSALKRELDAGTLTSEQAVVVREVWREFNLVTKLPAEFVRELAQTTSEANAVWVEARAAASFAKYQPSLEKIVALKQREAEYLGYTDTPYDPLLDTYEPYMTTREVAAVIDDVKAFLIPFIKQITAQTAAVDTPQLTGKFPLAKQIAFNERVAKLLGYDFDRGRLDASPHPFTTTFHPEDVRITTRYREDDIFYGLPGTIHEVGHALYEQGLPIDSFGTPLAEAISLGIHESQSKLWETQVGLSRPFWEYFFPLLQHAFPKPFASVPFEAFYRAINRVRPSLIRVEADEVTYNLHIVIRFEIERDLLEGNLAVADLPRAWNAKYADYLGVTVPDDARGVLQDVHWSHGSFGYFPTYLLGTLYAAQFFAQAQRDIPNLDDQFRHGNFGSFRGWLAEHIHRHGKTYRAQDLVKQVTGEPLTSRYFTDYLQRKYRELASP